MKHYDKSIELGKWASKLSVMVGSIKESNCPVHPRVYRLNAIINRWI